jgi:hypothetical protein
LLSRSLGYVARPRKPKKALDRPSKRMNTRQMTDP